MRAAGHALLFEEGDGGLGARALEDHAQAEMYGDAGGVEAFCSDGVEADADAEGVEADFADETGFGDDFEAGKGGLVDGEEDEVFLLGGHPLFDFVRG